MIRTILRRQIKNLDRKIRFRPSHHHSSSSTPKGIYYLTSQCQSIRNFSELSCVKGSTNADVTLSENCDTNELTTQLIHHLERTSLVDFESSEALSRLTESINFAQKLFEVDTRGVEPLVTVLENQSLYLRDDAPEQTSRKDILSNATITEEDYFVAPPGNVPLEPSSTKFT